MRNFIIISLLTVLFVSGSFLCDAYLEKNFILMADEIEKMETEEELKAITEKWEKLSNIAEIFVDHGDLEEVSRQLWAMEKEIKYDIDEFMESKAIACQMLFHIKDRNTVGIINIL